MRDLILQLSKSSIYSTKPSIDSPMARALLKKEVGDLAVVNTPGGEASWYVNEIEYVK
ncbi:TPA: GreA/GreB family elongation factor [Citrobacter freundii]